MITLATALRVADVFWPAFVEQDGCVFLASEVHKPVDLTRHESRTAAESFQNHVHVTDVFRHAIPGAEHPEDGYWIHDEAHPDFERAWQLGRHLAEMWAAKLRVEFPGRVFRVYLTRRDTPIVRFHAVRAGEAPWAGDAEVAARGAAGDLLVVDTHGPVSVRANSGVSQHTRIGREAFGEGRPAAHQGSPPADRSAGVDVPHCAR